MDKLRDLAERIWNDIDDTVERAAWTAGEVAAVILGADAANWTNPALWKQAAMAAGGAFASALKNALRDWNRRRKEEQALAVPSVEEPPEGE